MDLAGLHLDEDVGDYGEANRAGIDDSRNIDDVLIQQALQAVAHGPLGDVANLPGNVGAGHASVLGEEVDDLLVDRV